jgi:hypothetical protein
MYIFLHRLRRDLAGGQLESRVLDIYNSSVATIYEYNDIAM